MLVIPLAAEAHPGGKRGRGGKGVNGPTKLHAARSKRHTGAIRGRAFGRGRFPPSPIPVPPPPYLGISSAN